MRKRHLILMAMSTLCAENSVFEEKDDIFIHKDGIVKNCSGQLEPIVKKCIQHDECDNMEIVLLCTEATRKKLSVKRNGEIYKLSSVEYFMMRIYEEMHGVPLNLEDIVEEVEDNEEVEDDRYQWKKYIEIDGISYIILKSDEKKFKITTIDISEDDILGGVVRTAKYMQRTYNENKPNKFWIDTHGGFRDLSIVCNAVVSVLGLEKSSLAPGEVFGIRYGKGKEIVSQKEAFNMFHFVSAVETLLKYGDASLLKTYFQTDKLTQCDEIVDKDELSFEELRLIELILDILEKINLKLKLCSINNYGGEIEKLKSSLDSLEAKNILNKNSGIIDIFIRYVRKDYKELLCKNKITVLDIIRRCVDKKLYQQALTIIEARMPQYILQKKIVNCGSMKVDNFNEYINMKLRRNTSCLKEDVDIYVKQCIADSKCIKRQNQIEFNDGTNVWKSDCTIEQVMGVLARHKLLKLCRNKLNHTISDRPQMTDIVRIMNEYVDMIELMS